MTDYIDPSLEPGLVSVMMPAYNAERYIRKAIKSLLNQTYYSWELILVNDGSTDQTQDIIDEFTDPRIRVFYQENSGEASARNHALSKIRGEFLAFLDADDFYHPSFLALMVSYLNQHTHKDAVYCDGFYVDSNDIVLTPLSKFRRGPFEGDLFEQIVRASDVFGPPMTVMLRSERVIQSGLLFDSRIVIGPDWDFFTHLSQFVNFGFLNKQICFYRVHQANITLTAGNTRKVESLALCRQKMLDLPRFHECKTEVKYYVFYDLFVNLISKAKMIEELMSHPSFIQMPPCKQSQLIRLALVRQLTLHSKNAVSYANWLSKAEALCPQDKKTAIMRLIYILAPSILRLILKIRESLRPKSAPITPFDI